MIDRRRGKDHLVNVMNVLDPLAIVDRYSNFIIIIYEDDVGGEEDREDHRTAFTSHLSGAH